MAADDVSLPGILPPAGMEQLDNNHVVLPSNERDPSVLTEPLPSFSPRDETVNSLSIPPFADPASYDGTATSVTALHSAGILEQVDLTQPTVDTPAPGSEHQQLDNVPAPVQLDKGVYKSVYK